jgi:hypothetical protein
MIGHQDIGPDLETAILCAFGLWFVSRFKPPPRIPFSPTKPLSIPLGIARFKPLLLKRFPASTADELTQAHAYAYGGSIIQDLGYYPFGSKFYSDLTHYVRSGDFILNLIRESQDLDEYAFALGALSHYAADDNGHRMAVNVSVPLLYPKLRLKFGNSITYADDPFSHTKTEFGFDVFQAAKRPLRFGRLQRLYRLSSSKTRAPAGLSGYLWNADRAGILQRRSGDRIVPAGGRDIPSGPDQSRVANQEPGDQEGRSRHHPQEIPLQSVPLQLREELGRHLSTAGYPVENAGGLLSHRAQSGPIQGAGVQEADTGDRKVVHGQLQRVDRPVSRVACSGGQRPA